MVTVHRVSQNEYGHSLDQKVLAYEVRFTTWKDGDKWRRNHTALVLCRTAEQAIDLVAQEFPDAPIINQVLLRNNEMHVLISDSVKEGET